MALTQEQYQTSDSINIRRTNLLLVTPASRQTNFQYDLRW